MSLWDDILGKSEEKKHREEVEKMVLDYHRQGLGINGIRGEMTNPLRRHYYSDEEIKDALRSLDIC